MGRSNKIVKRKILFNAGQCKVGGGAQVAANLVAAALASRKYNYVFLVSNAVLFHLNALGVKSRDGIINVPDAAPLISGRGPRSVIANLINKEAPDLIFTVFGPSYINSDVPEICGLADPWITHATRASYRNFSLLERLKTKLVAKYKKTQLRKDATYWVETDAVKRGLIKVKGIASKKIFVIPNTCSDLFRSHRVLPNYIKTNHYTIGLISAPYKHKNLTLVPKIVFHLLKDNPNLKVDVITTLDQSHDTCKMFVPLGRHFGRRFNVENRGVQNLLQCKEIYRTSSFVLHPSLLEAFSATYAESICMGTPIFVSDFDFAKTVCGDAAIYIDVFNPKSAAASISKFANSELNQDQLRMKMLLKSKDFLTNEERFIKFENMFESVFAGN